MCKSAGCAVAQRQQETGTVALCVSPLFPLNEVAAELVLYVHTLVS